MIVGSIRHSLFFLLVVTGRGSATQVELTCNDLKIFRSVNLSSCGSAGSLSCKFFRTDSIKVAAANGVDDNRHRYLVLSEKKSCKIIGVALDSSNLKIFNSLRKLTEPISMPVMASALVNELFEVFQVEELKTILYYKVEGSWPVKGGFTVLYFVVNPWVNHKEEVPTDFGCIDVDTNGAMKFSSKTRCLDVFLASQKEMVGRFFSAD